MNSPEAGDHLGIYQEFRLNQSEVFELGLKALGLGVAFMVTDPETGSWKPTGKDPGNERPQGE